MIPCAPPETRMIERSGRAPSGQASGEAGDVVSSESAIVTGANVTLPSSSHA